MAEKKSKAVDFNDIIQADRRKRKNENLANNILGKNRRASAPTSGAGLNRNVKGSLASRVGVKKSNQKSSGPAPVIPKANITGQWVHDLHGLNNPQVSRVAQLPSRRSASARVARDNRLFDALNFAGVSDQANVHAGPASGLSIRGAAGPFAVLASNFAPGTTAADIEAAMQPVAGEIQSCRLVSTYPSVIAEIVIPEKDAAENVISTFSGQKADGRILYVRMKSAAPSQHSLQHLRGRQTQDDLDLISHNPRRNRGPFSDSLGGGKRR